MREEREVNMKELALKTGFAAAEVIAPTELVIVPEYRKFCEQNLCGNYGTCYGCPPYCGTVGEMRQTVLGYRHALVLQSRTRVENLFDEAETKQIKRKHTRMTQQLIRSLKEQGLLEAKLVEEGTPIMAGACNLCETCHMPAGEACPHEEKRFSCLSAYCIDASKMARTCGMDMSWEGDIVSFFSVFLYGSK